MAAYGPFACGLMIGQAFAFFGTPNAFFYWAAFFAGCIAMNWWFYARQWRRNAVLTSEQHARTMMSHFLDRLAFFKRNVDGFSDGHGASPTRTARWEDAYRKRWPHDKIVRSTHGVNCTGSCSWKIYVKGGIVTWETQQTDYPRTRPGMPNHEPRGCSRGARYSWYLYSASRMKYPMVRGRLVEAWRDARKTLATRSRPGRRSSGRREDDALQVDARPRRLRALDLGRGERDHRRRQRPHHQDLGAGSRPRLLADPGDVDGLLRLGRALSQPDRRVCSPSTTGTATCRRRARRPGASRPTCRRPPTGTIPASSCLGLERAADAHARRPFLRRGALQRHQVVAVTPDYSEVAKLSDFGCTRSRAPTRRSPWPWAM